MNRFQFVLDEVERVGDLTLPELAAQLNEAVATVIAEGDEPIRDPAVLVLGAWVAFHTHADVNTVSGYRQLLDVCRKRASEHWLDD